MNRSVLIHLRIAAIAAICVFSIPAAVAPIGAHAATCSPVMKPAAEVAPSAGFDTPAHIVATFNNARSKEGCSASLSIDQNAYASATPQMQMLMLFNAERQDRGLSTLALDSTVMSQIDYNHSKEMAQYGYFDHPSPINHPGDVFSRIEQNPAIGGNHYVGENISGYPNPAQTVYVYMYQDSGENWGHRDNILGYYWGSSTPGGYNWVGIGVYSDNAHTYYTSDFLEYIGYAPPATADTTAPTLNPPKITSAAQSGSVTVQATNVQDMGAPNGVLGLTAVLFYAGTLTYNYATGAGNAVPGTLVSGATWTANLSNVPAGAVIHAVAVDGSGNYTDCASNATSCGSGIPSATLNLSVTSGPINTLTTASGSGFTGGETISFYLDSASGQLLGTTPASGTGTYSKTMTIPAARYGAHQVVAVGGTSHKTASATFAIRPTASIPVRSGTVGARPIMTVTGFGASETVSVHWGTPTGPLAGSGPVDGNGSGSILLRVPMMQGGSYTLYVTGPSGAGTTLTYIILPKIRLSATSGPPNSTPTLSGSGFRAGETVTVRWNCPSAACATQILITPHIAANGTFGATTIHIPQNATPGTSYPIGAKGSTGDFALTRFNATSTI